MISCFIFTALACEAKPFIKRFSLKKELNTHSFTIYRHHDMVLTVSGVGKVSMAAAVGYTLAKFQTIHPPVLINIGIAGHSSALLGTLWRANKIIDLESARCFYPQPIIKLPYPSTVVYTASKPSLDYAKAGLYDMEASGFYEVASCFSSAELIHVFKVVSDNPNETIEAITAQKVRDWLDDYVDTIEKSILSLQTIAEAFTQNHPKYYDALTARYYFNVNNSHQLKKNLARWQVLTDASVLDFSAENFKDAKAVLKWLQAQLDLQVFHL
ncbi:MAG: hypothetical protein KAU26_10635 [Methylococcales bacterium]|nr:hypothetical protein [Methylococcales bacterium]